MEQRFGRYRAVAEIGRGGMAIVYEAYDEQLSRAVALKTLHPTLAAQQPLIDRFLAEARLAAQLDDPQIVPVYDVGLDGGRPYFTMKLVRGASLQTLLSSAPLRLQESLDILRQVAAALDSAHRSGVVHRDVKPGNILIADSGRALVTDFGIASLRSASVSRADLGVTDLVDLTASLLTSDLPASQAHVASYNAATSGAGSRGRLGKRSQQREARPAKRQQADGTAPLVGTPEYVAPECVLGHEATAASDIYALGIVTYQMLLGRPPFEGSPEAVLRAHVHQQPSFAGIALPLRAVLQRALAKDYGARFVSAGEFARSMQLASRRVVDERRDLASAPTILQLPRGKSSPWLKLDRRVARAGVTSVALFALLSAWLLFGRGGGGAVASSGSSSNMARLLSFVSSQPRPTNTPDVASAVTAVATATATSSPTATATAVPTPTPTSVPMTSQQQRLSVAPGQTAQASVRLLAGDRVTGSFFVDGTFLGIGGDIVFRIARPDGSIVNVGRVDREHQFQFTAERAGEHRLLFQNPSIFTGRQVYLTITHPQRGP